ncbi:hypothetical protein ECRM12581_28760 (plasmid) [Escherichia coli O145:H28 str. RM12581]|uniref:Transposase n=1 Tax=Escherichia coli O145:H28 (strain RM12581) TaxID=1248823 RepID=A0ABC8A1P1_ECOLR|nr:hypothetical protein ECRM13514_5817 [Escherichia coli O145:H28 str. RM13514]AHY74156.1 hypothetical protein ECRM12581_28760 [Escherichia coli O145:H28 str. RM12581]
MPAFEWVHVQLHQQKGMISLSPPTICNSALVLDQPCDCFVERSAISRHVENNSKSGDFFLDWLRILGS